MSQRVIQIPVLKDNYAYLLVDEARQVAALLDPADDLAPLCAAIQASGATITDILCTHHHWDHADGVAPLVSWLPTAPRLVASEEDAAKIGPFANPSARTLRAKHGDVVEVGGLRGRVLLLPCHTRGHVAYLFGDDLFCGDTLFVAGCGRFFEGDAADMDRALHDVLGALPGQTRVHCGHEYTVSNLRFARSIEPENAAVREKLAWAEEARAQGRSTVPSTLAEERRYNPFLRVREPAVQAAVGSSDPVEVMARLRERKNNFTG